MDQNFCSCYSLYIAESIIFLRFWKAYVYKFICINARASKMQSGWFLEASSCVFYKYLYYVKYSLSELKQEYTFL